MLCTICMDAMCGPRGGGGAAIMKEGMGCTGAGWRRLDASTVMVKEPLCPAFTSSSRW